MVAKKRVVKKRVSKKVTKKVTKKTTAKVQPKTVRKKAVRKKVTKKVNPPKLPNHGTTEGGKESYFKHGHQLWRNRKFTGRYKMFTSANALLKACTGYFNTAESSPLYENITTAYKGEIIHDKVPKMRAMTVTGLCIYIGIGRRTWDNYKADGHEFCDVANWVQDVIYQQKFEGAAAGLLNHAIIAKEIGLRDDHSEADGKSDELADAFARIAGKLPT